MHNIQDYMCYLTLLSKITFDSLLLSGYSETVQKEKNISAVI